MKLESKLGISTGVLILAMLVSASTAHLRLKGVMTLAGEVDGRRHPFTLDVQALQGHLANSIAGVQSCLVFAPPSAMHTAGRIALESSLKQVDSDISSLRELDNRLDLGADDGRLPGIMQQVEQIETQEREAFELSDLGTPDGTSRATALLETNILPPSATVGNALGQIVSDQIAIGAQQTATLRAGDYAVLLTLWTATVLGAIVGGLVSFFLARRITHGIALVSQRADAIASGDLTGAALTVDSTDQIGTLAGTIQRMQQSLGAIIGTVARTAGSFTASALSMGSAADQVHRRVDQQAQQTQQAATAMQEMSASIAEVSRHTQSAAETARSAAQIAHEGGEIVKQMLGSMRSIATAVSETSSTVGLLGEDSRRISQIVTVIDEIAR
jgi:methyl-accepting chemotaxis protein